MEEYEDIVSASMHELRYFNQRLKSLSEQISKELKIDEIGKGTGLNLNSAHADQLRTVAEGLLSLSQLFTTRLDFIDIELNPGTIEELPVSPINIFAKFDKARRMLNSQARGKNVKIKIEKPDRVIANIDAYPLIDILPYLILDNSVKYSPDGGRVDIDFEIYQDSLIVNVCSLGPHVPKEELKRLIEKGYRGQGAKLLKINGSGIGLHFVKFICELHEIKLHIDSGTPAYEYQGVSCAPFSVRLEITAYNHTR